MKRLKHEFLSYNKTKTILGKYLSVDDVCKFCGKSAQQLFVEADHREEYPFYISENGSYKIEEQLIFYNLYSPCLTEEEYIIKTIIE